MGASDPAEPLRVRGPVAVAWILSPHRYPPEPFCAVHWVVAPQNDDAQVAHRNPQPPQRSRVDGARCEVDTFDQQVRPRNAPQLPHLAPKPPLDKRFVQTQNGLSLNNCPWPHDVVTYEQALPDHDYACILQSPWHSRRKLVHIGCNNGHIEKHRPRHAGESDDFEKGAPTSHFAKAKWQ
jgi:hypothetical protein